MRAEFCLHPDDVFADLPAPIIDDRGLPIGVGFAQFLEETAGKTEFRESGLKLIIVLEFFALLRSHVGLEKDLARVIRLRGKTGGRETKDKTGEQNQPDFIHALEKPEL